MGGKQRWTAEEEQALRDGVDRYGPGKWRTIQKDPEYGPALVNRSNVDLKDKWRNLTADPSSKSKHRRSDGGAGSGSKGRSRARQQQQRATASRPTETTKRPARRRRPPLDSAAAATVLMGTGGARGADGHVAGANVKPEDMVIASIISLCEPRGSHPEDIQEWIESQYNIGDNFGRLLGSTLKQMVESNRLEQRAGSTGVRYRLATLKYAPANSPDDASLNSELGSSDMRGVFDQSAFEAAQSAAAAVAEAAEAAARADRLGDAAALFELAARQAEADSPGHGWSTQQAQAKPESD